MNAQVVLAADGGEVKSKLTQAGKTIQGILTGLVALAAAIIWILPWVYSLFT